MSVSNIDFPPGNMPPLRISLTLGGIAHGMESPSVGGLAVVNTGGLNQVLRENTPHSRGA